MYKLYDTECKECGQVIEQLLDDKENPEDCPVCQGKMERIFTKMHFKLIYDNKTQMCGWSHNNYAHNCYWDEYRKAKAEGKDVRPATEDP